MRLAIAALLFGVLALAGAPASATSPERAKPKKHKVHMIWVPVAQDVQPSGSLVIDTFESNGRPFNNASIETETPRAQAGEDQRTGKWEAVVRGEPGERPKAICRGAFEIEREVIETADDGSYQVTDWEGSLRLKFCGSSKEYRDAQPGPFAEIHGRILCQVGGCAGGLRLNGSWRY